MEWHDAKRMEGGSSGFYQQSESPGGYCITYTKIDDERATFSASYNSNMIGSVSVDPANKELVRGMGRVMRTMCGTHSSCSGRGRK